jgi:hypothetical protein
VMYKLCDLSEGYYGSHVATELYKGPISLQFFL